MDMEDTTVKQASSGDVTPLTTGKETKPARKCKLIDFQFSELDPLRPVTSPYLTPQRHFQLRLLFTVFVALVFIFSLVGKAADGILHIWPYTLEGWVNVGFLVYLASATYRTYIYWKRGEGFTRHTFAFGAHHALYCTLGTLCVFSTVGFWSYVFTPVHVHTGMQWFATIGQCVINPIILIVECLLGRQEFRIVDNTWAGIPLLFYMFWMFITHAYAGVWPYWTMGWDQGTACIKWYFIDTILLYVLIAALILAHRARDHVATLKHTQPLPVDTAMTGTWPFKTDRSRGVAHSHV